MGEQMRFPEMNGKIYSALGAAVLVAITGSSIWGIYDHVHHRTKSAAESPAQVIDGIDLLDGTWNYMDGVTSEKHALQIAGTDSKIVEQDGEGGQPNPAVNLYGTRLKTTGNIALTAHLSKKDAGSATVRLYNKPPVIADEFRIEPASIAVTEKDDTISIQVWDGRKPKPGEVTDAKPAFSQSAKLSNKNSDIVITRVGSDWQVRAGDTTITNKNGAKPFTSGDVWLGLSSPDSGFMVDKLVANGVGGGSVATIDSTKAPEAKLADNGLQALANKIRPDFVVGSAAALGPWMSDKDYTAQLTGNFKGITIENALKPQFISPKQGVYTFQEADALIALAEKNGMTVHGHTIAFTEALPQWMRNLPHGTDAEKQASGKVLLEYVRTFMTHYKGKFKTLDVINEPLDPEQGPDQQENIWSQVFGPDYGAVISQTVYEIDPDVKQFVNENGTEMRDSNPERQDALLSYVQQVNAAGGHIVGIGLQSHVYDMETDTITAAGLNDTINRYGQAGFLVRVSENDVTDDNGTDAQAEQFSTVFMTCLQNKNCIGYSTWGVNDRYDWFIDDDGSLQQGHDLLFNGSKATSAFTRSQYGLAGGKK